MGPLLLIEILLVMKLDEETFTKQAWLLGLTSALMIASGYLGELIVHGSLLWLRWVCWVVSMCFFLNIVRTLLVGLAEATEAETDEDIKKSIKVSQWMTVISCAHTRLSICFPMLGMAAS